MCYSEKVKLKADALVRVIKAVQDLYSSAEITCYQKEQIETIIGAGIMYIQGGRKLCWSGKMSIGLIRKFHPDSGVDNPKICEDHEYPRKLSAKKLLKQSWPQDIEEAMKLFLELYGRKYGKVNYVTKEENKQLQIYHKNNRFSNPRASYNAVGISLLRINILQLKNIKNRNEESINIIMSDQY